MSEHDKDLARAFDGQAERFERAPVQSDPAALAHLVQAADFPPGALVLDCGCGPGLVARAFLEAGFRVVGVDLSAEMIDRARRRCAEFGTLAQFIHTSLFDSALDREGPFDAAVSRYVIHHVVDPLAFVKRQVELVRPGGAVVASDHLADPDPTAAATHHAIEVGRDRTHTRNLTPGGLVDLFARAGLNSIRLEEESFALDFDEWFDRGSPSQPKDAVRALLLNTPPIRGFTPTVHDGGAIRIDCLRAIVRGAKP